MITLQTDHTISLPCDVNDIKHFTINNCDFYFLDRGGCKLIKWSLNECTIETILLERKYLCICYDQWDNCYWAVPECEAGRIYRLDECFCETDYISIKGAYQQRPISVCCDCCGKGLWICYPGQSAYMEKCNGKIEWYKNKDGQRVNRGMSVQCSCRINCYCDGCRETVGILSPCDGESLEFCAPKEHRIVGVASEACVQSYEACRFWVLLSKVCPNELTLAEYCIDFSNGRTEPCCPQPCPPEPCPFPCPPEPHCAGIYEVMHSIALEEAGISHILNAEGEKIQKAVAISDNIEELICVNESVKRTLTQVTLLEGMLYSKLEALVMGDSCCGKTNSPCHFPLQGESGD